MYEFLVLGGLARGPKHGYLIAKIINDMIGPFRGVSWGALYPILKRLETDDLIRIEEKPEGEGRARTIYAITDAGHRELHELLMNTDRHLAQYDRVFAYKVSLFPFLTQEERLVLCRHYAAHAQENIDHQERERKDLEQRFSGRLGTLYLDSVITVMNHQIAHWRGELRWAQELIDQYQAQEAS